MNKLFISGFALDISELELARLIVPYGDIDTLKIVRDRKTRICKGYAFVEMKTAEGADLAREVLNGMASSEQRLTVNHVEEQSPVKPAIFNKSQRSVNTGYLINRKAAEAIKPKRPRRPVV
ncbi:RNA recognition motif domain-containing protein [Mucilaginibacter sp.]